MFECHINATLAGHLAPIANEGVTREFPNIIHHVMNSAADVGVPSELTPAFYGCYDWHSAVHTHWQMVRLWRARPDDWFVGEFRDTLAEHFSRERLAVELEYMTTPGREGFERPYGLSWLLLLVAEMREFADEVGGVDRELLLRWLQELASLASVAVHSLSAWLPKLTDPIRSGEHSQTMFSMGLLLDYAGVVGDGALMELVTERALTFHKSDSACPLSYEPSGHDFLSPCLAEADLMRRVLSPTEFSPWLRTFLPTIPTNGARWIEPVTAADPDDGKLAHFDGLNLSRAWMLEGILSSIPQEDPRADSLRNDAELHREKGLAAVQDDMSYMGSHWLGSFAVYLTTCRGIHEA